MKFMIDIKYTLLYKHVWKNPEDSLYLISFWKFETAKLFWSSLL